MFSNRSVLQTQRVMPGEGERHEMQATRVGVIEGEDDVEFASGALVPV